MLFNSFEFLVFFPIVVLLYFTIPYKARKMWLLIASYYFYMCCNAKYALLIFFSTVITWLSGLALEYFKQAAMDGEKKIIFRKLTIAASFVLNLSLLFYFKYINSLVGILNGLFSSIHISLSVPTFDIILPVGISFYTFQALGYTMDVYRDEITAEKNFFQYALFVSFFPQLVAGPIERSKNLLGQLKESKKFNPETAREGFLLMLWGFFLKIVIADRIALFVDTVYEDYAAFAGLYLVVATMLFAIQIYCDFYGYSVIAAGAAGILGIRLMENFDAPYLSTSVTEFWRRWHISLTSWFRDYLYFPLGGGRRGKIRKYFNKMVVFLVSGLWHGAAFSYMVWGGVNGVYQIVGEVFRPVRDKMVALFHLNRESLGHKLIHMVGTFLLVDFSWIFFRANGMKEAVRIIKHMFTVWNPEIFLDKALYKCGLDKMNFVLLIICLGVLLFADCCKYKRIQIREVIIKQDYWFRCLFIVFAVSFILIFGIWGPAYNEANFIYFQF